MYFFSLKKMMTFWKNYENSREDGNVLLMVENPLLSRGRLDGRRIVGDVMQPHVPLGGHLRGIIVQPDLNPQINETIANSHKKCDHVTWGKKTERARCNKNSPDLPNEAECFFSFFLFFTEAASRFSH